MQQAIAALPDHLRTDATFHIYVTTRPLDATEQVRSRAALGYPLRVYACGGDGTLNECINGAAGFPNVTVTHFPAGTGNDFIKQFGSDAAYFSDLQRLVSGQVRPIDLIECSGRYAVNIASVGLDARIGRDVHKYTRLPLVNGSAGYVVSTAVNFCKRLSKPMNVTAGGVTYLGNMTLVCICNGSYYGGGFHPIPDAQPDDGMLDCLIVRKVSHLTFVRYILAYARGRYDRFPEKITRVRGRSIRICSPEQLCVNMDGESVLVRNPVFRIVPAGVNFLFPDGLDYLSRHCVNNQALADSSASLL